MLIDSRSLKIETYHQENNKWIYDLFENNEEIILNSLEVHFSFADAYIDIEFEDVPEVF